LGALKRRTIIMIMIIIIIMPCNYFYINACVCAGHDSDFDASRQARFPYTCAPFSGYEGVNPNHTGSFFGFGSHLMGQFYPSQDTAAHAIRDAARATIMGGMVIGAGSMIGDGLKFAGYHAIPDNMYEHLSEVEKTAHRAYRESEKGLMTVAPFVEEAV
jgi:hypothetical protein